MSRRRTRAHSDEEKQGMRAHDERGNVRPADGRWDLHKPSEESKYVKDSIEVPAEVETDEDTEEN